jgi:hypothetical protein
MLGGIEGQTKREGEKNEAEIKRGDSPSHLLYSSGLRL